MKENSGRRLLELLLPIIIYEGVQFIVQVIILTIWAISHMDSYFSLQTGILDQAKMMKDLTDLTMSNALLMQTIACVPAVLILFRLYRKDAAKRRFSFDPSSVPLVKWPFLLLLAATLSISGNCFLNIGDIASSSEGFEQASRILFSGSEAVQVIGIGFLIPICEELLFRGLIYMRMRQYMQVNIAILVSALVFGIIHGNIIQMIYAFVMGMIFAWLYEKYGTLIAPAAAHIAANLTALALAAVLANIELSADKDFILTAAGLIFSLLCAVLLLYLHRTVQAKRIYTEHV